MKLKVLYSLFLCVFFFLPLKSAEIASEHVFNDFEPKRVLAAIQQIRNLLNNRKYIKNREVLSSKDITLAELLRTIGYHRIASKFMALANRQNVLNIPNDHFESSQFLNFFEEELDKRTIRALNLITQNETELPGAVEENVESQQALAVKRKTRVKETVVPADIRTLGSKTNCVVQ